MIGFLSTLFIWPNGIVVGNLIASALWATPALIHLHRKIDRNHREHMEWLRKNHNVTTNGQSSTSEKVDK